MAKFEKRYPENVPGKFYTDTDCIDCDLCFETAPANFARRTQEGFSYVKRQPITAEELALCLEALEGCPTEAIGSDGVELREDIYKNPSNLLDQDQSPLITDFTLEIKRYLARNPEKIYDLTPRRFEILIADILRDFGFETELTQTTRDGGRDIYAYIKNAVTSFLVFVECKKWSPDKKIGIDVVQRVHGAAKAGGAHRSMIVTTSFFTSPAVKEQQRISGELELKDYRHLKEWLARYE